ncbi:hypothetical protein L3X38_025086 [Prunus dulcis]|uniref:Uncharacterized protein n=1 Tax=Prunus dulcis TaxID=3755 RepID=A0AAD4W158_PRUDU|nr:hypothetical protein L3X38_025086 [Prunus dulcis]
MRKPMKKLAIHISAYFNSKLKVAGSSSDFEFSDPKTAALDKQKEKPEMEENEGVQNANAGINNVLL